MNLDLAENNVPAPALSKACVDVDLALGPAADSDGCVSRSADRLSPMDGAYIDCVMRWDPCGAVEDDDGDLKGETEIHLLGLL